MRSKVNNKVDVVTLTRVMLDTEGAPWAIEGPKDGSATLRLDFGHLIHLTVMGGTRVGVLRAIGAAIRSLVPQAADLLEGYSGYGEGLLGPREQCNFTVYGGPSGGLAGYPDMQLRDHVEVARCINSDRHHGDHLLMWKANHGWAPRIPASYAITMIEMAEALHTAMRHLNGGTPTQATIQIEEALAAYASIKK